MIAKKRLELSFEVKEELEFHPEFDKIGDLIQQAIQSYILLRKVGKFEEAQDVKLKIKEMKFAQKNIYLVMNLDFDKPSAKMIQMAKDANVDLKDKRMLEEFKSV